MSKLKSSANNTFSEPQMIKLSIERGDNAVEIGENSGYYHVLLFSQCFQNHSTS